MAWGERAAEQYEKDQPSEIRIDTPRQNGGRSERMAEALSSDAVRYDQLMNGVSEAEQELARARQEWWTFIECRAERGVRKPYEICGEKDAWHPRHLPSHPDYNEDDLVPGVECQLPEGHRAAGYRNHLEMRDGEIMGAWG